MSRCKSWRFPVVDTTTFGRQSRYLRQHPWCRKAILPAKDADGIDDNGQKVVETTFWRVARSLWRERSRRDKLSWPGFAGGTQSPLLLNVDGEHLRFNYLPTQKVDQVCT
jgi:hypothetical protein